MSTLLPYQLKQYEQCKNILSKIPERKDYKRLDAKLRSRLTSELHHFLQYLTINTKNCPQEATHEEVHHWLNQVTTLTDYYYRQKTLSLVKDLLPQARWRRPKRRPFLDQYYRVRDFLFWHLYENKKTKLSRTFFEEIKQNEIIEAELLCVPFYRALNDVSPSYGQVGGFVQSDEDIVQELRNHLNSDLTNQAITIVDIACGAGRLLKRLAVEFPQAKLMGTSIFEFSVEEIASFKESNIEAIYCEADKINMGDDSAHLVVCSEVIEHLKEPSALASEIYRILKPGGVFCVTAPSKASYMYTNNPISYLSVFLSPYRGWFLPAFHNLYAPLSSINFVHYGFTPAQFHQVFTSAFPKVSIRTTRFTALRKFRVHNIARKLPFLKHMGGLCMAVGTKPDKK